MALPNYLYHIRICRLEYDSFVYDSQQMFQGIRGDGCEIMLRTFTNRLKERALAASIGLASLNILFVNENQW